MTSTHKFIHFGCWNKGVCENEATPLAKVMHSLRNYTVIEKPEFIVVAGDNYYPEKVKNKETKEKEKTVIPKNLAARNSQSGSENNFLSDNNFFVNS